MSTSDVDYERADLQADEAQTRVALTLPDAGGTDAHTNAVAGLRDDTQSWSSDELACPPAKLEEGEQPATLDTAGLRAFITDKVLPWFKTWARDMAQ